MYLCKGTFSVPAFISQVSIPGHSDLVTYYHKIFTIVTAIKITKL